jgi:hypothetical protein
MWAAEDAALMKAAKSGDTAAARAALDAGADKNCKNLVRSRPLPRCAALRLPSARGRVRLHPWRRREAAACPRWLAVQLRARGDVSPRRARFSCSGTSHAFVLCVRVRHSLGAARPRRRHFTRFRAAWCADPLPRRSAAPCVCCVGRAQYGNTPLHEAACEGHASVVTLLLERGADMEAKRHVRAALRPRPRTSTWPRAFHSARRCSGGTRRQRRRALPQCSAGFRPSVCAVALSMAARTRRAAARVRAAPCACAMATRNQRGAFPGCAAAA